MKIEKILRHCRINKPRHFRLARHEPAECFGLSPDADEVKDMLMPARGRASPFLSSSNKRSRVTSWSTTVVPATPPSAA